MAGYGTDEGLTAYLTDNGLTLPEGSPTPAALRQRGSNYLDATYGHRLTCSRPTGGIDQERAWPRTGHLVNCQPIPSDAIPQAWVRASYRAAWLEAITPGWGSATINPSQRVKRQKVDVIEREFFEGAGAEAGEGGIAPIDAEIDGMVALFLCPDMAGLGIAVV